MARIPRSEWQHSWINNFSSVCLLGIKVYFLGIFSLTDVMLASFLSYFPEKNSCHNIFSRQELLPQKEYQIGVGFSFTRSCKRSSLFFLSLHDYTTARLCKYPNIYRSLKRKKPHSLPGLFFLSLSEIRITTSLLRHTRPPPSRIKRSCSIGFQEIGEEEKKIKGGKTANFSLCSRQMSVIRLTLISVFWIWQCYMRVIGIAKNKGSILKKCLIINYLVARQLLVRSKVGRAP